MPDSGEMSPAEVARTLKRLEQGIGEIRQDIRDLDVVRRPEYDADQRHLDTRLTAIETDVHETQQDLAGKADAGRVRDIEADIKRNRQVALTGLIYPTLLLVIGAVIAAVLS